MTDRPRAHPTLLAALTKATPARITKKLDASPRAAEAWAWAAAEGRWTVTTDAGEVVTVTGAVVSEVGQLGCSCLLSPRCFHVLAVASALAVDEGDAAEPAAAPAPAGAAPEGGRPAPFEPGAAQRAAARAALAASEERRARGASGAGAVVLGELLRAAHEARACGLPRLGAAAMRVAQGVRALREERPEFTLDGHTAALLELGVVALALATGRADASHVGVARREYEPVGSLALVGLVAEPVIATGYAGVVSYACDGAGRVWTVNEIGPSADAARALSAYGMAVRMGDTSIPHRALVREGLFVEGATGSRDRRLGAGSRVKAVRSGPTTLDHEAVSALFRAPLDEQIARAYASLEGPLEERSAAATLVFAEVEVVGAEPRALVVAAARPDRAPLAVRLVAPSDAPELAYASNLRLLARAPGLRLRVAGHVVAGAPRTLAAVLAASAPAGEATAVVGGEASSQLTLPSEWGGRVCLGLDRLQAAHVAVAPGASPRALPEAASRLDPLAPLRRRLERVALGGSRTLGPGAQRSVDHERGDLGRAMMPEAARALGALAVAAARRERLAEAWLSLAVYERAATRHLLRAAWR
ncbi:MAG: hypothetical protein JNL38_06300 [Myxococcales bacterium]|nr:hypothetical protein [Myxococcales bacterium]